MHPYFLKRLPPILTVVVLLTGMHCLPTPARSQLCDQRLEPLEGTDSGYRQRGNRCEGLFESKISAPRLDLVSLTVGRLQFAWQRDTSLSVEPPKEIGEPIRLRAMAIPLGTFYQMDARLEGGASLRWPIREVLFPEELNDRRIGVLGWLDDGRRVPLHVPVVVQSAPAASSPNQDPAAVTAILRSSVDVQFVSWRVLRLEGGRCTAPSDWTPLKKATTRAGKPILLVLPKLDVSEACIEVKGKEADSADLTVWTDFRLRIPT